ncbi:type IV pilus assembly protein PilM [Aneurinibacillus soli]|uniref:Competence protein A n=1 Tax=Aneurinibacillus soli TaxID=1500254 RepID=A0A0U5BBK0_9BACL|nr:pilus assembly protein PilM [Aneurinibacillus soli]PYE64128.1 type IV pilus assembly protein PilM [Aneurinibacillus soli]BAU28077.1 Competence protein A [Aneurinibacillus soli]
MKFFKPRTQKYLGLDIDHERVTVAEMLLQSDRLTISTLVEEKLTAQRPLSEILKDIIFEHGIQSNEAILSLPFTDRYVKLELYPKMPEKDLIAAISLDIEQMTGEKAFENTIQDYCILGDTADAEGKEKTVVMFVTVSNEEAVHYYKEITSAGLSVRAIEIDFLAFLRTIVLFKQNIPPARSIGSCLLCLHVSMSGTILILLNGETPIYFKKIPFHESGFFHYIKEEENLSVTEMQWPKELDELHHADFAIRQGMSELVRELNRAIDFFTIRTRRNVSDILVSGRFGSCTAIRTSLLGLLGITVHPLIVSEQATLQSYQLSNESSEPLAPQFALALGLSIREVFPY